MQLLLENIASKISLTPAIQSGIEQAFILKKVAKNELILREDQYCRHLFFIEKGTVRTFYYHNLKDVTSWFYPEGYFFTAWSSFYNQQASFEYIEAVEEAEIYAISYDNYQQFFQDHPDFEKFGRLLAESQTSFIDQYSKGYLFLSAKERYQLLLELIPDIELRVKLGHIASFLGISQETLSRIRSGK